MHERTMHALSIMLVLCAIASVDLQGAPVGEDQGRGGSIHLQSPVIAETGEGLFERWGTTVLIMVLGSGVSLVVFRRFRHSSKALERRVLERTKELVKANQELQNEIAACKRHEKEQIERFQIEQERKHLQEAVRANERVLTVVGHELRTPLASMRAMAEFILSSSACISTEKDRFIEDIRDEAIRMADKVNDLIEVARTNSGYARWHWSEFSVRDACEDALIPLSGVVNEAKVRLKLDVEPPELVMNGDRNAIRRLVLNVANNACMHTPKGSIEVRAKRLMNADGDWIEIQVCDTGEGMPPEIAAKLGEPFALNRGVAGDDYVRGSGLGLAICKGIVSVHGGRILVSSQQGVGTTITAQLRADLSGPTNVKEPQYLICEVAP
ncbi:MAG: HAMP domain-containing histidine kinase [Phycisphaerales bacterium]|nr:HAMP domain-containing histidine kinase [Phycisphaerales bacterium]